MSTPDTPQPTSPPEPSASAATPPEGGSSGLPDSTSNGQASAAPEDHPAEAQAQPEAQPVDGASAPQVDGQQVDGAAPLHGEKKRRRRRRKRRLGAPGGADAGASEGTDEADGADSAESAAAEEAGESAAEAKSADRSADRERRKKRERKPGPPRERPPVNGGDIIFGKILEITDEAILIDIPGKARAIFDRREMLLLDDDEPPPRRAPAVALPPSEDTALEAGASTPAPPDAPPPAPPPEVLANAIQPEGTEAVAPVTAAPPAAAPQPVAPEPPKEPKVPRVILEVGADFIGVVHNDGARGGLVVLTHHPHRAERAKPLIEKAFNEKTPILALVTGVIKGGVELDVDGLRAFAPGSHVDLRLGADLSHLVGQRLPFAVTEYAKRGRDVVLSRRSILEEDAKKARSEALAKLKVGEDLDGIVRSVVPFGAFVDVGGVEGLVPLQEMSHNRSDGPSNVFTAGEATRVRVMKVDDRGKVWLSRKATIPDPWQEVAQKYAVGTRHAGKVARLQPFGAFIELESGVDGLIHLQDLSIKRIEAPGDVVKVGDPIDVVVAHLDPTQHKIGLHPALQGDAATEAPQKVAPHKPVKAKIVNIESGGLVVRILGVTGRSARGYVTAAGTGTPRGTELRKSFNVGQEIDAKVIEVDPRRGEVKLSIKALSEDQERSAYQQYRQQLKAEARFTFGDLLAKKTNPQR
jgi:small subunit ribosomal protein S1